MTLQFPEDPKIDALLKMTNDVVMKIKLQTKEMYL
jgi:hypothetical protein